MAEMKPAVLEISAVFEAIIFPCAPKIVKIDLYLSILLNQIGLFVNVTRFSLLLPYDTLYPFLRVIKSREKFSSSDRIG